MSAASITRPARHGPAARRLRWIRGHGRSHDVGTPRVLPVSVGNHRTPTGERLGLECEYLAWQADVAADVRLRGLGEL
jgi:hypothetical protein